MGRGLRKPSESAVKIFEMQQNFWARLVLKHNLVPPAN